MDSLFHELEHRRKRLEQAIDFCRKLSGGAPEGHLRIDQTKPCPRYYLINNQAPGVHYIRQEDKELAKRIAQREYGEKVIRRAEAELRAIDSFCSRFESERADDVFAALKPARQALIRPALLDDELYVRRWLEQDHETNPSFPEGKRFQTRQGQMVRSKVELMQANVYDELGIPYKYECKLILKDGTVFYPDFTALHVPTRRMIYHEHMGMMDDPDYQRKAMSKIAVYAKNGIYVGKNLILTFDTRENPFDLEVFRAMVKDIFQCDGNGTTKVALPGI